MASNKFGAGVPNTYEYRTAIGGKRAVPMLSEVRADTAAKLNEWDLRYVMRNPEAATIYRNAYTVSKEIRFEKSPSKGGNPVYEAINVPIEQQPALARAMKPTSQFGSAASHTQFPELSREPDVRGVQTTMIQTEQFKNAPQWEKKAMLDYEPAFANTGKATRSIKGMDIDAFGNTEQISGSLIKEPGSMVQVRTWETIGGQKTYLTEPSGKPATALVSGEKFYERGYVPEDVVSVSKGGATFQIDVKGVPEGYPRIKGYVEPTKTAAPYINDARVLLGTRLLGSPFEVIPKEFDVIRGGTGKDTWMKETTGFQSQRLMEAAEKNLAGSVERYAGDPFYRGNRLQKDTQRLLSTQEELLEIKRARLEVSSPGMKLSPKDASRIGMAEKSLQTWRNTEFSYQLERMAPEGPTTGYQATANAITETRVGGTGVLDMFGRKPGWTPEPKPTKLPIDAFMESREYIGGEGAKVVRGTPQALAETGMENYRMGMDIGGTEIQGPIRTGVGVGKMLQDYPAPKSTTAQEWLDMRAGMDPFGAAHAKGGSTKPKTVGKMLADIPYKKESTADSVAKFLKKSGGTTEPIRKSTSFEPVEDTYISPTERNNFVINIKSPEVSRPSLIGPFSPVTLGSSRFSPEQSRSERTRAPYAPSLESPRGVYTTTFSGSQKSVFSPMGETQRSVTGASGINRSFFGSTLSSSRFTPAPSATRYTPSSGPGYAFPSAPSKASGVSAVTKPIPPYGPTGGSPKPQPPYTPDSPGPYQPNPPPPYEPEPPNFPFGGGQLPGGGGGYGYKGNLGVTTWRRNNLVADMPYLAKGMRSISWGMDIGSGAYSEKTTWFKTGKKRKTTRRMKK